MSILSKTNSSSNMGTPFLHEFKKQASFFFKEKIKTARLALTDVTPAQLLTEEATNGNPWAPDTPTLAMISRAAFEVDDFWRIVDVLHNRLSRFERKNWRVSYNSLVVIERLLTHGPESTAEEFQRDKHVIREMESFQFIDERGFNWGLAVRKKAERILKLLENGALLKDQRDRSRKLTREIQGFGSFCHRSSTGQGILRESSAEMYGRCNSQLNVHDQVNDENSVQNAEISLQSQEKDEKLKCFGSFKDTRMIERPENQTGSKENLAPEEKLHVWDHTGEANPLLDGKNDEPRKEHFSEEDHPFNETENQTTASLLSAKDGILQGC